MFSHLGCMNDENGEKSLSNCAGHDGGMMMYSSSIVPAHAPMEAGSPLGPSLPTGEPLHLGLASLWKRRSSPLWPHKAPSAYHRHGRVVFDQHLGPAGLVVYEAKKPAMAVETSSLYKILDGNDATRWSSAPSLRRVVTFFLFASRLAYPKYLKKRKGFRYVRLKRRLPSGSLGAPGRMFASLGWLSIKLSRQDLFSRGTSIASMPASINPRGMTSGW